MTRARRQGRVLLSAHAMDPIPFRIKVVTGLGGCAFLWRDVLFVSRARSREATDRRILCAVAAVLHPATIV
jgi:hypothetical protein